MAPNRARRIFVPTNPDLADILGRMDLNFENFDFFFHFLDPKFLDFQDTKIWISRLPKIWISRLPKNPHGGRGADGRMDGRTDGRTDGRATGGRTGGRADGRAGGLIRLVFQDDFFPN